MHARPIFGAIDPPTCANFALQRTAWDNIAKYFNALQPVFDKFCIDDYMDAFDSTGQAFLRSRQLIEMLQLGDSN